MVADFVNYHLRPHPGLQTRLFSQEWWFPEGELWNSLKTHAISERHNLLLLIFWAPPKLTADVICEQRSWASTGATGIWPWTGIRCTIFRFYLPLLHWENLALKKYSVLDLFMFQMKFNEQTGKDQETCNQDLGGTLKPKPGRDRCPLEMGQCVLSVPANLQILLIGAANKGLWSRYLRFHLLWCLCVPHSKNMCWIPRNLLPVGI